MRQCVRVKGCWVECWWVEARSGRVFSYLISDPRRGKLGIFGSRGGRPWILNTSSGRGYVETQPRQDNPTHGRVTLAGSVSGAGTWACVFAVSSRQSSPGARSVNMLPLVIVTFLTAGAQACNILGGSYDLNCADCAPVPNSAVAPLARFDSHEQNLLSARQPWLPFWVSHHCHKFPCIVS